MEAARSSANDAAAASPIDGFSGDLTVDVHAPDLKADGPLTQTLTVPTYGDSAKLRFRLVATTPGVHSITVSVWNGSALVAGLTLEVAVGTAARAEGAEARGMLDVRAPSTGEYTLDVAWEQHSKRYRFQLRNDQHDVWQPMYSDPLLDDREATYKSTLAMLNTQARNLHRLDSAAQERWMRGMGTLLFEYLVPDALGTVLVAHRPRIKVLNILSQPDSTPWELLYVADSNGAKEGDFLASGTTVARWRYGSAPERALRATSPHFVLPSDAPPKAHEELVKLRLLFGKDAGTIEDIGSLHALLERGDFGLLHFAAHNVAVPDALAGAYVPFGPQRWDLVMLSGVPVNRFRHLQPLVFMNACTTSGTTQVYTDLSSWADRFLKCGAGAFIGTLWEVRDGSARRFSEHFYERLIGGDTIGEAMQSARQALRNEEEGDPTPFAYTLYGNAHARWEANP
ncbi:MAG: CHAT domain-containing protein [Aquincola sp.]|nr:CHAT domain-containing protein [Aquincola sp.]